MFSNDRILTLDVGASKIVLGEFSCKGPSPVLTAYAVAERDPLEAGSASGDSFLVLADAVREMMAARGIKPAPLHVCLPGQTVFPRFMKIPAATADMVDSMIRDEAAENLPFPLDQVVWDYWKLGADPATGELDALIVATKSDTAQDVAALAEATGLPLAQVDAAPIALYNAVRFNYPEAEGCTLALDIGARATNLVFAEGDKVFMRTIPIAGNTITNEIARGLGVEPAEAERIKKEIGFVALGGTYAVTDDETADRVSKIVRNVATRLHSEVNRSINFYRSQQGGSAPDRVLLTGGSSLLRHMDTFFAEKLGVEAELLNPFSGLSVAQGLEEDSVGLFLMAPSTGLALRGCARCPVEINLIPPAIAEERRFRRRLPFFGAAVAGLVLTFLAWGVHANGLASRYEESAEALKARTAALEKEQRRLSAVDSDVRAAVAKVDDGAAIAASRAAYPEMLDAIRSAMLPGMWITSLEFRAPQAASPSDRDAAAAPAAPTLRLSASGFKGELDRRVAANRRTKGAVRAGSAGEFLCNNLLALRPALFAEAKVVKEGPVQNNRVTEMVVEASLARPLGRPDASWIPEEPAPGDDAEPEDESEDAADDGVEEEPAP